MKMDASILETRYLDEWSKLYEIYKHPPGYHLRFVDKLRIHVKYGFRMHHIWISLLFRPLDRFTRTQRLTIAVSILFGSMCANALFFQFGVDQLSVLTFALKLLNGVLSSIIVFVPTSLCSFVFRRIKLRAYDFKLLPEMTQEDLDSRKLTVRFFFLFFSFF